MCLFIQDNKNGCCDGALEESGHGKQLRSNQQEEERRGRRTLKGQSAGSTFFTGSAGNIFPQFLSLLFAHEC